MLNSTMHEISIAHYWQNGEKLAFLAFKFLGVYILLINIKMPTISILTLISMIEFMHGWFEHENFFKPV